MKTSNKLLFGLLGFIVLAIVAVNIILKKTLTHNNTKTSASEIILQQESQQSTDTIVIDTSIVRQ